MAKSKVRAAIALIAAFAVGAGYVGFSVACNSWNPAKWVSGTQIERPADKNYGSTVIGESAGNGIQLMSAAIAPEDYAAYGISPLAENAQVITATFTPAGTTNKAVTWSVSGGDGKVTVTPIAGTLQATVTVSEAFSSQASITCASNVDPSIKASCSVDYVKAVNIDTSDVENWDLFEKESFLRCNYGVGTITPDTVTATCLFEMDGDVYDNFQYYNTPAGIKESLTVTISPNDKYSFADLFLSEKSSAEQSDVLASLWNLYSMEDTNIRMAIITVTSFTASYNGKTYQSYNNATGLKFYYNLGDMENVPELYPTAINIGSGLIFGVD